MQETVIEEGRRTFQDIAARVKFLGKNEKLRDTRELVERQYPIEINEDTLAELADSTVASFEAAQETDAIEWG